jgi:hypothetical protein
MTTYMTTYRLRIERDDHAESPNEAMDDPAFIVTRSNRYFEPKAPKGWDLDRVERLLGKTDQCSKCGQTLLINEYGRLVDQYTEGRVCGADEDGGPHVPEENDDAERFVAFPLYAYIHGGVALSLGAFGDRWDSGQIGYVVVDLDGERDAAEGIARAWVETWNTYLSGEVYGYVVERIDTCNLGHEHAEQVDSCWGFYGDEQAARDEGESSLRFYENRKETA